MYQLKVGNKVQVKKAIKQPSCGWGNVNHKSVGIVTFVDYFLPSIRIDFPNCPHWQGVPQEIKKSRAPYSSPYAFLKKYSCTRPELPYEYLNPGDGRRAENIQKITRMWGLPIGVKLSQHAADFYILLNLQLQAPHSRVVNSLLEKETEYLTNIFSTYLTMVIGGETRYVKRMVVEKGLAVNESLIDQHMEILLKSIPDTHPLREAFWFDWLNIVNEYGKVPMLKACYTLHSKFTGFSGSIGGKKWALACKVLLDYLEGKTPAQSFVDTAWNLQHNGTIIFSKTWDIDCSLVNVLEHNKYGNINSLSSYASSNIQSLWNSRAELAGRIGG
uniref:Uncharacterized protein n=1 Tax=viral metagenome TaxID=1070528 RepID=A0A6M3LNX2_9ZZZZ